MSGNDEENPFGVSHHSQWSFCQIDFLQFEFLGPCRTKCRINYGQSWFRWLQPFWQQNDSPNFWTKSGCDESNRGTCSGSKTSNFYCGISGMEQYSIHCVNHEIIRHFISYHWTANQEFKVHMVHNRVFQMNEANTECFSQSLELLYNLSVFPIYKSASWNCI